MFFFLEEERSAVGPRKVLRRTMLSARHTCNGMADCSSLSAEESGLGSSYRHGVPDLVNPLLLSRCFASDAASSTQIWRFFFFFFLLAGLLDVLS